MLDKIKIYNRKTNKEILSQENDNSSYSLCFKKNGEVWLEFNPLLENGVNCKLLSNDPLNKFPELKDFLFSKDYILTFQEEYFDIEWWFGSGYNRELKIYFQGKTKDIFYNSNLSDEETEEYLMFIFGDIYKVEPDEKIPMKYFKAMHDKQGTTRFNYSDIGEDNYIKLLKIIY